MPSGRMSLRAQVQHLRGTAFTRVRQDSSGLPSRLPSVWLPIAPLGSNRIQELEASAGFEPAVEVLQTSARSSPEFVRFHSVSDFNADRSLEFAVVYHSALALPSALPSNTPWLTCIQRPLRVGAA